jgi:hypothetical protein
MEVTYKPPNSRKTSSKTGTVNYVSSMELRFDDAQFRVKYLNRDRERIAYHFEPGGDDSTGGCEVKEVEIETKESPYRFDIGDKVCVDWSDGMGPQDEISGFVEAIGRGDEPVISVTDYDTDEFGDAGKTYGCAPGWISLPDGSESDETDSGGFGGFEFGHSDHNDESETDNSGSDESGEREEPELVTDGGRKEGGNINQADLQAFYSHNESETLRGHTVYAANRITDHEMWKDLKLADRLLDAIDPEAPTRKYKYGIEHICAYGSQQRIGVRMEVENDPLGNGIITSGFEGFDVEAIKPVGYGDVYIRFQPSERGTGESNESNSPELVTDGGREVNDSTEDAKDDTGAFVFDNASTGGSQSGGDTSGNDAADANDTANESDGGQEIATDALTEIDGVGDVLAGRIAESFDGETGYQTLRNVSHAAASAWSELAEVNGISDDRARGFFEEMQDAGVLLTPNRPDTDACEDVGADDPHGVTELRPHDVRQFAHEFGRSETFDSDRHRVAYRNDENTAQILVPKAGRVPLGDDGADDSDYVDLSDYDVTPDDVYRADIHPEATDKETRENIVVIDYGGKNDPAAVGGTDGFGMGILASEKRTFVSAELADAIEEFCGRSVTDIADVGGLHVLDSTTEFCPVVIDSHDPTCRLVVAPCSPPGHESGGLRGWGHNYELVTQSDSDDSDDESDGHDGEDHNDEEHDAPQGVADTLDRAYFDALQDRDGRTYESEIRGIGFELRTVSRHGRGCVEISVPNQAAYIISEPGMGISNRARFHRYVYSQCVRSSYLVDDPDDSDGPNGSNGSNGSDDSAGNEDNEERKTEAELVADGGAGADDSTEASTGAGNQDGQDDHSDETNDHDEPDDQDRERPLQPASDAFDRLREGDIIEVAQYQGTLRVSSIARDMGMIGIEFVDESKRANGATKHLIQNEHSGDIALVSGRSDKGKVAMIAVLERSQDGRESQDDDGESETDDHEEQDEDSHEDDVQDDVERESVLPEAGSLETPSGWEVENDERVATATCDDWHTGSRKTVLFVQHPETEEWHVREQGSRVQFEGPFADRSDAVRAFEQVVWNLNEQSDALNTIHATSSGEVCEQARARLNRLDDERDAILNGSGGRLPDADDHGGDGQNDGQNDTGGFVFDHSDETKGDNIVTDRETNTGKGSFPCPSFWCTTL